MSIVSSCLWFDDQAEEAASFYVSIFPNSKLGKFDRHGEGGPGPAGGVMTVEFELDGVRFTGLNGGPMFKFSEATSFVIDCKDQAEVDHYWDALLADGGAPGQCGWLKDRFGLSWQVVPVELGVLMSDPDSARVSRVIAAMMQMARLDTGKLRAAADGAQG
ncbi:VOC family protein [Phenylobacterium sp.]|uniref:VOC family protein n=1 Tax=Phenylobacterium sp. TaxID=1871053 RepID=UPI00271EAD35|nr:VOC family protein [Phenylobacterium sp.]MDO8799931.1 VOC family protein [Phenylobacterium sp.]